MSDILVTTPVSEHNHAREEGEWVEAHPEDYWFRTLKRHGDVKVGDRVYYVDLGVITGYGVVFNITYGEMEDSSEGTVWDGMNLCQREWHWLAEPRPKFKGFQGFRYIDRIAGLRAALKVAEIESSRESADGKGGTEG